MDSESDWLGRARREASVILAEALPLYPAPGAIGRSAVLDLMAMAWLQGVNLGAHDTLGSVEKAFTGMKDAAA